MKRDRPFFIGWRADPPDLRRRAVLGAGFALAGGAAAGLAAVLSAGPEPIGPGVWDDGQARTLTGVLLAQPFPLLVTPDLDGQPRTVFLASDGKSAAPLPAGLLARRVRVAGTLIQRGTNAMLAVDRIDAADGPEPDGLRDRPTMELGEVMLTGEVLDAKCWFGAMRPAYGKTHKACASLCVRGGLPVAFCRSGDCGTGVEAPLFLDAEGNPHGAGLLPFVADPVRVQGHLVRVGDVVQLRAPLSAVRRI